MAIAIIGNHVFLVFVSLQHAGASPQYEGDDLVYSGGGGSGCWDDEDDCGESDTTGRKR